MRGIKLKDSIQNFGFREGLGFWFRWSFRDPIEMWVWLNLTHKPYCLYAGYHCDDPQCKYEHLKTKKQIKAHWKQTEKEMEQVERGPDGLCVYCGEEKANWEIPNPNMDKINQWSVCETCKKIIEQQQKMAFGEILLHKPHGQELGKKLVKEAADQIDYLAYESGKEVFTATIEKKNGNTSNKKTTR